MATLTETLEELDEILDECSGQDWDGYDSMPVRRNSVRYARRFLLSLPLGTEMPSLGVMPAGNVSLEWQRSPRQSLTVTVDEAGTLHYAGPLGPEGVCGTLPYSETPPKSILDLIAECAK